MRTFELQFEEAASIMRIAFGAPRRDEEEKP